MSRRSRGPRRTQGAALLVASLAIALSLVALDTKTRVQAIRTATALRLSDYPEPARDASSPSGYELAQHRLVLPGLGVDAYHWILQAERASAADRLRLRDVDYDNAPGGREVHWAAAMRWWASALAAAERVFDSDDSGAPPLERVIPWANTLLLVLLLVTATAFVARPLGALPAALFALGCVATYPFHEYFVAGYFDHHGLATFASALSVLLLAAGGAGWVRAEKPGDSNRPADGAAAAHCRTPRRCQARRWFLASAAAAAVSMWVSAATAVPVLLGVGVAALVSTVWLARAAPSGSPAVVEPALWRIWGFAGGSLSLVFYAIEYVPSHVGVRLEVNHPLYALAWLAGGDLLYRLSRRARGTSENAGTAGAECAGPPTVRSGIREGALLAVDVALIAAPAAAVLFARDVTFRLADPFLWTLHADFIIEFLSLSRHVASMRFSEIAAGVSLVPLAALPIAALLWSTPPRTRSTWLWRALLVSTLAPVLAFLFISARGLAHAVVGPSAAVSATVCALAVTAGGAAAFAALIRTRVRLPFFERARLAFLLVPPLLPLALSLGQVRWLGISSALWVVAMVGLATALGDGASTDFRWTPRARLAAASLLALLLLPYPLFALRQAVSGRSLSLPLGASEVHQLFTREVAHRLRARVGNEPAIVFSSPTSTTRLIYFGGFRGIGTLYWENLSGLEASADIYASRNAEEARKRLTARGITHLVFFSWDRGLESLYVARSGRGTPESATSAAAKGFFAEIAGDQLPGDLPSWLIPLPFPLPAEGILRGEHVSIFEVVPDLPRDQHLVRLAHYYRAINELDRAEHTLRAALAIRPSVPALALLAQLQRRRHDQVGFEETVAKLRAQLAHGEAMELVDRVHTILTLALAGDMGEVSRQMQAALAAADERQVRRTPTDVLGTFVGLCLRLGVDPRTHDVLALAVRLLPDSERSELRR